MNGPRTQPTCLTEDSDMRFEDSDMRFEDSDMRFEDSDMRFEDLHCTCTCDTNPNSGQNSQSILNRCNILYMNANIHVHTF